MKRTSFIVGIGMIVTFLCVSLIGCATMFTEKTQQLSFKTKPAGAEVALGVQTCISPCTMVVQKGKLNLHVMVTKDGYRAQSTVLSPNVEPWFWANFANLGFGMIVDVITGTAIKYEPEYYIPLSRN